MQSDQANENNDWKSKYQATLQDIEQREQGWADIEKLLRKTIGRLCIAGRGLDSDLDQQLRIIQDLSREGNDPGLAAALDQLSTSINALHDPGTAQKPRRADPIMLMLELLQNIHFNSAQRGQLKRICSDLLVSVANGHDRDSVSAYIQKLSLLINENFDHLDSDGRSARLVLQLLELLELEEPQGSIIRDQFRGSTELHDQDLNELARLLNEQINSDSTHSDIDEVMTTLLERLAIIQGARSNAQELQARVHEGIAGERWPETLNDVVNSISTTLKNLEQEKLELETFIVRVTEQLGEVTAVISEDQIDLQSNQQDTQSLHAFVEEGMDLMQKNFQSSTDLQELKDGMERNIEDIRGGVKDYATRLEERHEITSERNLKLTEQLSKMEQETQELQVMLQENREKLLYDALTGVYSRMAYDERLMQEVSRWNRYQTPFAYVILDIDHFKRINDNYGHNAGDKALKIVAQMMLKYVRQSDYVFRIGGEEFVMLLTNTATGEAGELVEKMRAGIACSSFHFQGEPVQVTLSAGLTETRPDDTVESIYERADKALYRAKNSGRNCQFIAD